MSIKNNTLMVIVRMSVNPENVATKVSEFGDAEWMTYLAIAPRSLDAAQAVVVLDADKSSAAARRIMGRNSNGTLRLSKDSNAFGLEGWDFSEVLADKKWLRHPRVTATIVVTLDAKGNYNGGNVEVVNWNDIDKAERDAAKAAAQKAAAKTTSKTAAA